MNYTTSNQYEESGERKDEGLVLGENKVISEKRVSSNIPVTQAKNAYSNDNLFRWSVLIVMILNTR